MRGQTPAACTGSPASSSARRLRQTTRAVASKHLEARLELVERVREQLVLECRVVARARERLLAVAQLAHRVRDEVGHRAHRAHEGHGLADEVPGRHRDPSARCAGARTRSAQHQKAGANHGRDGRQLRSRAGPARMPTIATWKT